VDLAFVQGGSSDALRAADEEKSGAALVSLGSLSSIRCGCSIAKQAAKKRPKGTFTLDDLAGWRVNTGVRGSGTPGLMGKLLHANGIERESLVRSRLELTPAVVALLSGELDAIVFTSAPEAPMVQMLLQSPGVKLFEFGQAEAYARRMPFLSTVVLRAASSTSPATCRRAIRRLSRPPPRWSRASARTRRCCNCSCRRPTPSTARLRGSRAPGSFPRRCKSNTRSPRKPSATIATARRSCSAICPSGSPISSTACGWCSPPSSSS